LRGEEDRLSIKRKKKREKKKKLFSRKKRFFSPRGRQPPVSDKRGGTWRGGAHPPF